MSTEEERESMSGEKDKKNDLLCGECGETFSNFLHEMAEKNAEVTTCPKCGKIHEFNPKKAATPAASSRPVRKQI